MQRNSGRCFFALSNAIKYSPHADKVLVNVEEKENVLQLSIHDFGIGMASQHLNKIFDRYYRVEEHSKHFQGLGIGLYISYDIITRHQGSICFSFHYIHRIRMNRYQQLQHRLSYLTRCWRHEPGRRIIVIKVAQR